MLIRDANPADLGALRDIYNDAVLNTTAIWNEVAIDLDNRRAWLELRAQQGFPVLVAEDAGAVVGYASYGPWRAFDGFRSCVGEKRALEAAHFEQPLRQRPLVFVIVKVGAVNQPAGAEVSGGDFRTPRGAPLARLFCFGICHSSLRAEGEAIHAASARWIASSLRSSQ